MGFPSNPENFRSNFVDFIRLNEKTLRNALVTFIVAVLGVNQLKKNSIHFEETVKICCQ